MMHGIAQDLVTYMHGNVEEWVEDCWHDSYAGNPPTDASAWTAEGNCNWRVIRDGSFYGEEQPLFVRSAARGSYEKKAHAAVLGFRVGRTLTR